MDGTDVLISIDPGDSHVGYAEWESGKLTHYVKHSPASLIKELESKAPGSVETIVVESFRLYPWLAQQQGFSAFKTPQLIGVIKYLSNYLGADLVEQGANIKKPAFAAMASEEFQLPKTNQHVKDAIAHGWWYYYNRKKEN